MTSTSQPAARARKKAPPEPAGEPAVAYIGYQPAGHDKLWHPVREAYRLVARRLITIDGHPVLKAIRRYPELPNSKGGDPVRGGIIRHPGEALCGNPGPWADTRPGTVPAPGLLQALQGHR
jgi:hypothetical protein